MFVCQNSLEWVMFMYKLMLQRLRFRLLTNSNYIWNAIQITIYLI